MSNSDKIKALIAQAEHITLNNLTVGSAERLPSHQQHQTTIYKVNLTQSNPRESMALRATYFFSFDDKAQNPQLTKLPIFPLIEGEIQSEIQSPRGSYRAVIRRLKDNKTVLEIWTSNNLTKSFRISDFHGALYDDSSFVRSALVWSQDESKILYIAEKSDDNIPKYWDDFKTDDDALKSLENFKYKEDFGEGYSGKCNPSVFVYDIQKNELLSLQQIPPEIVPTYVDFLTPDGNGLIFVGINLGAFKLGLKFCYNRDSSLYYIENPVLKKAKEEKKEAEKKQQPKSGVAESNIDSTIALKPDVDSTAVSQNEIKTDDPSQSASEKSPTKETTPPPKEALPRKLNSDYITTCSIVAKDHKSVLFLYSPQKHSHMLYFGMKLLKLDENHKPTDAIKTIFEPCQEPIGDFCGFSGYHDKLPRINFLQDSKHLVFNCTYGCSIGLYILNINTGKIKRIDQPKLNSEEWRLLKADGDKILAEVNNVYGPGKIGLYYGLQLDSGDPEHLTANAKWVFSDYKDTLVDPLSLTKSQDKLSLSDYGEYHEEIMHIAGINSIFCRVNNYKNSEGKVVDDIDKPLLVIPHGGPHNVTTGSFSILRHLPLLRGYNILCPNFSGSDGFGQKFVENLLGHIGKKDVEEIAATVDYIVQKGLCNPKRIAVSGSSYGGYLSGVLIAKYPEVYKVAVMRNPVVSLPYIVETSDTPEWCYAEVFKSGMKIEPTAEDYKVMHENSLLGMNKNVKASVMMMLGGVDKRVPPGGGLNYYKILKSKGVDVSLTWYPEEAHSIAGNPEVEFDNVIKIISFLEEKNV